MTCGVWLHFDWQVARHSVAYSIRGSTESRLILNSWGNKRGSLCIMGYVTVPGNDRRRVCYCADVILHTGLEVHMVVFHSCWPCLWRCLCKDSVRQLSGISAQTNVFGLIVFMDTSLRDFCVCFYCVFFFSCSFRCLLMRQSWNNLEQCSYKHNDQQCLCLRSMSPSLKIWFSLDGARICVCVYLGWCSVLICLCLKLGKRTNCRDILI